MDYNTDVFRKLYPMIKDFLYHYISYKEINAVYKDLKGDREFWCYTCNSHLKMATISWCIIFGTDSNEIHWKKLELNEDV